MLGSNGGFDANDVKVDNESASTVGVIGVSFSAFNGFPA